MPYGKYDLPIVPHSLIADVNCCGCLIPEIRGKKADLICNECSALIDTVPTAEIKPALLKLAMSGGSCSATCQYCRAVQVFPGFTSIDAFICQECGAGNVVPLVMQ